MSKFLLVAALLACMVSVGFGQDYSVVSTYKTDQAPELDGVISDGEWDAAGPPQVVSVEDAGSAFPDEDPFGGPLDASFQFRTMWVEPWTLYFAFEITDDIAMEIIPSNRWEMDQLENFFDGNDLEGNADLPSYEWWNPGNETYGKFGASRWEGEFEGNPAVMSTFIEDLYEDGFGAYAVAVAAETENNADFVVEYAISLEPMFDHSVFDGTPTGDAGQIVVDETTIKWRACFSDDDAFGDGTVGRSHTVCSVGTSDWRNTTEFSDLVFAGRYTGGSPGEYNGDGNVDAADADAQSAAMTDPNPDLATFDENGDGVVDNTDRLIWVHDHAGTWVGDSNLDGEFNSGDFVDVFTAGLYETGSMAGWAEGDWDGNMTFDSGDFVAAFTDGGYELGPPPAVNAVPEPSALVLLLMAGLLGITRRRRQ